MPTALASRPYTLRDHDKLMHASDEYVLRVKDLADEDRPREKLLASGPENLTLAELVAILWGVGTRKEDVLSMARRTLKEYGEKSISSERNPAQLAEAAGIPLTKACQIIVGFELGRRFYAQQGGRPTQVRTLQQAHHYFKDMAFGTKEQLRGLYLNSRYQVIHDEVISIGSLTSNIVHPREVFQPAIQHGAVAVIIAHNHPSGSLQPTAADIEVTDQLVTAGRMLGIDILDHLIIAGKRCNSLMTGMHHD